jgi:hypothetical protein
MSIKDKIILGTAISVSAFFSIGLPSMYLHNYIPHLLILNKRVIILENNKKNE